MFFAAVDTIESTPQIYLYWLRKLRLMPYVFTNMVQQLF